MTTTATTTTETSKPTAPTTKIVIVSGQEFSVPRDATEQDLRAHLATMFPDVTNATVQQGTKTIDGVTYDTIEFVKRAGTKGAADLTPLLPNIPALRVGGPSAATASLLDRVRCGDCTIAEALAGTMHQVIANLPTSQQRIAGATLCAQLDALSPTAGDVTAW